MSAPNRGQPWTADEDAALTQLRAQGLSLAAIGAKLGRGTSAISKRTIEHGVHVLCACGAPIAQARIAQCKGCQAGQERERKRAEQARYRAKKKLAPKKTKTNHCGEEQAAALRASIILPPEDKHQPGRLSPMVYRLAATGEHEAGMRLAGLSGEEVKAALALQRAGMRECRAA